MLISQRKKYQIYPWTISKIVSEGKLSFKLSGKNQDHIFVCQNGNSHTSFTCLTPIIAEILVISHMVQWLGSGALTAVARVRFPVWERHSISFQLTFFKCPLSTKTQCNQLALFLVRQGKMRLLFQRLQKYNHSITTVVDSNKPP